MASRTSITRPDARTTAGRQAATRGGTAATSERSAKASEPSGTVVLGRYRLQKLLGTGGFGTVWLARDERLERDVAVKMLPRDRVIGGRFEREARATARLSHPAIVTLYEAAVDDEAAYLVSELVRGATFAELLEAGRLSDQDVLRIGIAMCDALEHAHRQGVVHRDVKPSNLLVPEHPPSPGQLAKLTDFGVARLIGANTLTATGDIVGTAAYMAPEQAEGRDADAAADLYSLSLVLYEALSGINPIATGAAAGRARRLGAYLPPLRRQRRDLPRELGRCIDLALRPRPRERGSVGDLRSGLVSLLGEVHDIPGVVDSPWPSPARPPTDTWAPPVEEPGHGVAEPEGPIRRPRWSERALAAASAALLAAWLVSAVLRSPPLAPVMAAVMAGLAVAALPRMGWVALSLAAGVMLTAGNRVGAAVVILMGAFVPVLLMPRAPTRWPLAAAAPALGVLSLAGAWPALAARESDAWRRAALSAVGWTWVVLAGLVRGHGEYTQLPAGIPPKAVWMGSLGQTGAHALWPLVDSGVLATALLWALAAVVLPWIVRGPLSIRLVAVVIWSAALASATSTLLRGLDAGVPSSPGVVVIGAVAGGIVALAPTLRARIASASSDTAAGLA